MTDKELVKALKHLAVQTGSLACLGCGHEHSCSIHGCAVIQEAIEALEEKKSADQITAYAIESKERPGFYLAHNAAWTRQLARVALCAYKENAIRRAENLGIDYRIVTVSLQVGQEMEMADVTEE